MQTNQKQGRLQGPVPPAAEDRCSASLNVPLCLILMVWLTEFPLILAISFNFLKTPPAVRLAGWNIILWLLRELSATRPRSPFS